MSKSIRAENILSVCVCVCSNDDWGKTTTQTEDVAITEEDLELIKERETAIQQLEVSFLFLLPATHIYTHSILPLFCLVNILECLSLTQKVLKLNYWSKVWNNSAFFLCFERSLLCSPRLVLSAEKYSTIIIQYKLFLYF